MGMTFEAFFPEKQRTPVRQITPYSHIRDPFYCHTQVLKGYHESIIADIFVQDTFFLHITTISDYDLGIPVKI